MNATAADCVLCTALLCFLISSPFVKGQVPVSSINIEDSQFSCAVSGTNLKCSGNATTTVDGLLKLTPDPPDRQENYTYYLNTFGIALCKDPVQIMNRSSNQAASLNISFSFRIERSKSGAGDGLAFVMFSDGSWVGAPGKNFGAFGVNGRPGLSGGTLVVEFDTFENSGVDDDDNHVGFDVKSITSEVVKQLPFRLADVERTYVWIEYHPESFLLELRASTSAERPADAMISYSRNLMDVFDVDNVWVGFSAANGNCFCFSFYTVHNLNFQSSFFSAPPPPPSPPESKTQKSEPLNSGLIAGVTVGVAGILVGGCSLLFCVRSLRKRQIGTKLLSVTDGSSPSEAVGVYVGREFQLDGISLEKFSYDQLSAATENFTDALKLGEGGFGSVYRGSIPVHVEGSSTSSLLVAIKKVKSDSRQGEREFVAEVSTIGMLRHRNLVQLLSWCSESQGNYLLVYEYMPNGSLDRHLYPRTTSQKAGKQYFLTWQQRIKILQGIAAALHYLHEGWRQQVIHRDVKSSNVMLDEDLNAMLGDFGLARMSDHFNTPVTTCVAGTYGFIAPEVAMTGKYTVKSDVFSFGAVCLEVVCGRRVYDETYGVDETLLVDFVWKKLSEDDLLSVVDRRLEGEFKVEEVEVVLLLGLLCSHPKPDERPTMHSALEILVGSMELPAIPRTKPGTDHYTYPYQNKERKLFLSDSGRRITSDETASSSATMERSKTFSSAGEIGSCSK